MNVNVQPSGSVSCGIGYKMSDIPVAHETGFFCLSLPMYSRTNSYLTTGCIFDMTGIEAHGEQHTGRHLFIPAGILFGLGVGLIIGYPGPCVLIGLGLGFLVSAFVNPGTGTGHDQNISACGYDPRWISTFLGLFLIVIGVSFVWAPVDTWPSIFALFLIGLGLWFLARNCRRFR